MLYGRGGGWEEGSSGSGDKTGVWEWAGDGTCAYSGRSGYKTYTIMYLYMSSVHKCIHAICCTYMYM